MRTRSISLATLILIAIGSQACSEATAVDERFAVAVRVDTSEYPSTRVPDSTPAQYRLLIIGTIQNTGTSTVFVARCFPDSPRPTVSLHGNSAYAAAPWPLVCSGHDQPFDLAPGVTRVDTIPFIGPYSFDGRTNEALGALEGDFQLSYQVQRCRTCRPSPLDTAMMRSPTFSVRLSPGLRSSPD